MLKLLFTLTFFISTITFSFSQNYKSIEWDILGVTRLMPTTVSDFGAIGFHTEPRFNLSDRLSIGLKYEWQFFKNYFDEPIRSFGVSTSYALTADYYVFNKLHSRTFAGLAIGSFDNSEKTEAGMEVGGIGLGLTLRIGYEWRFLRITADYNHTFNNDFPNYFGIGLGVNIGGRHK